jgi:hypothetical protein
MGHLNAVGVKMYLSLKQRKKKRQSVKKDLN